MKLLYMETAFGLKGLLHDRCNQASLYESLSRQRNAFIVRFKGALIKWQVKQQHYPWH